MTWAALADVVEEREAARAADRQRVRRRADGGGGVVQIDLELERARLVLGERADDLNGNV